MANLALEKQLRAEMHRKFNVQLKSKNKKRKSPLIDGPSKKQKLSEQNTQTKESMINELKSLGLVQGSTQSSSSTQSLLHRRSFPDRNNKWKEKQKRHKTQRQNTNKDITKKIKISSLHSDINIYSLRNHLWYNLYDITSKDSKLCGHKIKKHELFLMSSSEIFMFTESLYNSLLSRDRIRNEFHSFALCSGTFNDRISTMVFRLEQLSLTRIGHLDSMIDVLSQDIKRQSVSLIPSLINLFIKSLLPQRHLFTFNESLKERINDDDSISQMQLILFYFEHLLKKRYRQFIELIEFYSRKNEIQKLQFESSNGLYKLLMNKPENEALILNLLINKFGENDRNFTRTITNYLIKIATKHPLMKPDIIHEINNYLKRSSLSPRGLYRSVFFLSKLRFTSLENDAARLLCGIYMDLFKDLILYQTVFDAMNGEEVLNDDNKNKELNIMKKLISMNGKKRNIYFKNHNKELLIWKRFVLLKEITPKILSIILKGISYIFPLTNIKLAVFRSDLDYIYKVILKSSIKIGLMALQFTFRVESTSEIAVSGTNITDKTPRQIIKYAKNRRKEIISCHKTPSDRFYQILYRMCCRWDFVHYSHPQIVFNLLYQTIKCDDNKARITAFIRRLIQFCCYGSTEWICGALYLFSAILSIHPFLGEIMNNNNDNNNKYNLNEYEAKLSGAEQCPIWELSVLCHHVHPAVKHFAKQLLNDKHIEYDGDPLKDFKRKVLFEKFTRIMAHKMKEFKPNKYKHKNKEKLIDSYLIGDGFIALYKEHYTKKERKTNEYNDDDDDHELDEDNDKDKSMADKAMFNWLKSHYGTEIPDDHQMDDDDYYDYSELKDYYQKEEQNQDSDIDVYLSDIDRESDIDEEEDEMTEKEKIKIGNQIILNEIKNDNITLPSDVEYASNDETENKEDIADFFNEKGVGAGELKL